MIKCASVFTYEIDSPEDAYAEISSQLQEKLTLMENTVGIILCHPEFIKSGTLKYICDKLPFDLVGATTCFQIVKDEPGQLMLTIFLITSDDVTFRTGITDDLEVGDVTETTRLAYQKVSLGMEENPKLIFMFPSILSRHSGDTFLNAWIEILPNVPCFGSGCIDDTVNFETSESIYNGETNSVSMPFVLCYGNINPRFMVGYLPVNDTTPYHGEVTKATGNVVHEINNIKASDYFDELGLGKDDFSLASFMLIPFLFDSKNRPDYDGVSVLRAIYSFEDDGSVVFRGDIDENSTFVMSRCSVKDVFSSTSDILEKMKSFEDVNGMLLFSCIVRRMILASDADTEIYNIIKKGINDVPFMFGYAGGEFCPTSIRSDGATNRYHSYTIIALMI